MSTKPTIKIKFLLSFLVFSLVTALQLLTPLYSGRAAAANDVGSIINLITPNISFIAGNYIYNQPRQVPIISCTMVYEQVQETDDLLTKYVGYDHQTLQRFVDRYTPGSTISNVATKIGFMGDNSVNGISIDQIKYLLDSHHYNQDVSMISFQNPSTYGALGSVKPINGDGTRYDSGDCAKFNKLIRVGELEWRGYQGQVSQVLGGTPSSAFMTFNMANKTPGTSTEGSFQYYDRTGEKPIVVKKETSGITVAGSYVVNGATDAGTVSAGSVLQFYWLNASQIVLNDNSSPHIHEIYTKRNWDQYSDYYLSSVPDDATDKTRASLVPGNSNSPEQCPLHSSCVLPDNSTSNNSVPFVHLNYVNFSFSEGTPELQAAINKLGTGTAATYYDYGSNGSPTIGTGYHVKFNNIATTLPHVWFVYSKTADSFATVFTGGDSKEKPHIGRYENTTKGGTLYKGPGGGCDELRKTGAPNSDNTFGVTWALKDSTCSSVIGSQLSGSAPLAIADEALFSEVTKFIDDAAAAKANSLAGTAPKLECEKSILNPLTWFVCPLVAAAQGLVGQLDDAINQQLFIRSDNIFTRSGTTKASADGYYNAWLTFRGIGLGLVAIGGLVSIIAFALGFEFLDAYTVRKVLPRLIIAVIGMSLSWYIMQYLVEFSNSLGLGIRSLIYAPFSGIHDTKITLGGGSSVAIGLVGGVAALALGLVGLLSLGLTAVLAVAIGFGTIIVRNIIVTFLIIFAPFAIACAILPNTQKAWKLWSDTFLKALLVFPIITAFIAAGRVFALLASAGNDGGIATGLIAFVAYFAPYFLIATAFKLAGGVIGTIGGLANNKSRGVFDRLKKQRGAKMSENFGKMKTGDRFQGRNALTRGFNKTSSGIGLGAKGGFGIGARGAGARDLQARAAAKAAAQNPLLQQLAFDDNAVAVMALSGGTVAGAKRAASRLGLSADETSRAIGTAQAVGFNNSNALAAVDLMAQNKSRAFNTANGLTGQAGMDFMRESIGQLAGGNPQLTENAMGSFAFNSRNAGRLDLGGESPGGSVSAGWQRASVQQHAQAFGASTKHYVDSFASAINGSTVGSDADRFDASGGRVGYTVSEKMAAAVGLSEMQAALPSATAENQVHINRAIAAVGVNHDAVVTRNERVRDIDAAGNDYMRDTPVVVPLTVEEQLANRVNGYEADGSYSGAPTAVGTFASASKIAGSARQYGNAQPAGTRDGASPPPTAAPKGP